MSGVRTYDPKNVQIIVGGTPMTGFADGTFLNVASDENLYNKTTGADGEVSRSRSNNRSATATITLKQTSQANNILSALAAADNASNSGVFPFMVKEIGSGETLIFAQAAWIEKLPDAEYSKDVSDRVWMIALGQTQTFIGGNSFSGVGA